MDHKLLLLSDVSRMLDVQPHRIVYLFVSRKLDELPMLGNRRLFAPADVRRVADALGVEWNDKNGEELCMTQSIGHKRS